ncbi:THAP domain-containing protein 11 [Frankliniella fusca]|uniref:THAP domain-containing protein 11 n=1 Tax=Frankliniella fusca TaxID=407009 RepID=A0AAE1HF77_9NEOP|nr:THAP domain-containing protein 11 [Frankliniella fusca]
MDKVNKKSRERHNCCVPQCSAVKNEENHLHTVPKDPARRKAWAIAIKTGKVLTDTMQVCSRHFKSTDDFPTNGPNLKPKLKKNAVPSENLPVRSHDKINPSPIKRKNQARSDRAAKRSIWSNISADSAADSSTNSENEAPEGEQVDNNMEGVENEWRDVHQLEDLQPRDRIKFAEIGVQTEKKLKSATGLHSVQLLDSLTKCADEIAPDNPCKKLHLTTKNRIVLTMMKIKLSISFSSLAVLFDLNVQTCCNYFYDMVTILSKILKCMIFWPNKEQVLMNMRKCFRGFGKTRVILDCYEIPVGKPKCIACRVKTYSHYKKGHTAKISMNITPSGLISLCSAAFGGRASDKVITKHTGIYDMCDPGDGIMVDKGYHIEEECENNMLVLIRPLFLRTNKKFSRAEAVQCAKIARARVHVERVIQRVRCFNILKNRIPWNLVPFIDDLVIIVSALVNLGNPSIARDKY